jgi:hypothetical protein
MRVTNESKTEEQKKDFFQQNVVISMLFVSKSKEEMLISYLNKRQQICCAKTSEMSQVNPLEVARDTGIHGFNARQPLVQNLLKNKQNISHIRWQVSIAQRLPTSYKEKQQHSDSTRTTP